MKAGKTIDEYFSIYFASIEKHGNNTVVLYQKGDFYEIYGVDNESEKIGEMSKISEITNMEVVRADGNIPYNNRSNPLMMGFPLRKLDKFVKILLRHGYNTVIVNQIKEIDKDTNKTIIRREIFKVYTPATYIDLDTYSTETPCLISLYIDSDNIFEENVCLGLSSIDLTTGVSCCYNFYQIDTSLLSTVEHIISTSNPRELIINGPCLKSEESRQKLEELLVKGNTSRVVKFGDSKELKMVYVNEFLSKVFPSHGTISPIEYLRMQHIPEVLQSYVYLLQYINDHDEDVLKGIRKPIIHNRSAYLLMSTRTHYHLNLMSNYHLETAGANWDSIMSIINKTSTRMGERFMKNAMIMPLTDYKKIKKRYRYISKFKKLVKGTSDDSPLELYLKKIPDLEKTHRRILLETISPEQFAILDDSYKNILEIAKIIESVEPDLVPHKSIQKLGDFMVDYNNKLNMDYFKNRSGPLPQGQVWIKCLQDGTVPSVDKHRKRCEKFTNKMNKFLEKVGSIANLKINGNQYKHYDGEDILDQYVLTTTKTGKTALEKHFTDDSSLSYHINRSVITITSSQFSKWSHKVKQSRDKLIELVKVTYQNYLKEWILLYSQTWMSVINFVAEVDFIKALTKVAQKYGYVKPQVVKSEHSFIDVKGLRHPLVELIHDKVPYVANDIKLGNEDSTGTTGILLYGANSAGKSTILKALGICIILAQMGSYVPARSMIYSPVEKIISKMNGEDNLYKGHSTHIVELLDLKEMTEESTRKTLILADEIASGTETISAVSELASAIKILSDDKKLFVFTTHYHELKTLNILEQLSEQIQVCHIEIIIKHGKITYNRKLKEGMGPDRYGIQIARTLDISDRFIKLAKQFEKEYREKTEGSTKVVSTKKSRYNHDIFMTECVICHSRKNLHTHHIRFQSEANENGLIDDTFNKNIKHNLTVLCEECHDKVHHDQLRIYGYIQTDKGIKLHYDVIDEK